MMLRCRASPRDFKAALSWWPDVLSIWRTKEGASAVARMARTARTPTISISENARCARWLLLGAQPSRLHWLALSPASPHMGAVRDILRSAEPEPKHRTSNIQHPTSNAVQPEAEEPTPDLSQPPSRRRCAMARREGGEGNWRIGSWMLDVGRWMFDVLLPATAAVSEGPSMFPTVSAVPIHRDCTARRPAGYVSSAMVGMARCAVPARVVAGGRNIRATLAIERVAPLHGARTSQRDVPAMLNRYLHPMEEREFFDCSSTVQSPFVISWHPPCAV